VGPVFHGSLASIQKILFCDKNKKKIKKIEQIGLSYAYERVHD
jgi:hypothetical protein